VWHEADSSFYILARDLRSTTKISLHPQMRNPKTIADWRLTKSITSGPVSLSRRSPGSPESVEGEPRPVSRRLQDAPHF
jgi:hypothetical protein